MYFVKSQTTAGYPKTIHGDSSESPSDHKVTNGSCVSLSVLE